MALLTNRSERGIEFHRVCKTLHRPLTLAGVDRRLFFLALLVGAATFNLFYSFLAGCLVFATIYAIAYWATAVDPQGAQIILRSGGLRSRYDGAKRSPSTTPTDV
jgi:type IV secretory pathway TrbD component